MTHLNGNALELSRMLAAGYEIPQDVVTLLKNLFAGTLEQMLKVKMAEHLGYRKHNVEGNNSDNSRNGYNKPPRNRTAEYLVQTLISVL